jgi:hypothetical protein
MISLTRPPVIELKQLNNIVSQKQQLLQQRASVCSGPTTQIMGFFSQAIEPTTKIELVSPRVPTGR